MCLFCQVCEPDSTTPDVNTLTASILEKQTELGQRRSSSKSLLVKPWRVDATLKKRAKRRKRKISSENKATDLYKREETDENTNNHSQNKCFVLEPEKGKDRAQISSVRTRSKTKDQTSMNSEKDPAPNQVSASNAKKSINITRKKRKLPKGNDHEYSSKRTSVTGHCREMLPRKKLVKGRDYVIDRPGIPKTAAASSQTTTTTTTPAIANKPISILTTPNLIAAVATPQRNILIPKTILGTPLSKATIPKTILGTPLSKPMSKTPRLPASLLKTGLFSPQKQTAIGTKAIISPPRTTIGGPNSLISTLLSKPPVGMNEVRISTLKQLKMRILNIKLEGFHANVDAERLNFVKFYAGLSSMITVTVDVHLGVAVHVHEREIPSVHPLLADLPLKLDSVQKVTRLLSALNKMAVCGGNCEERFQDYIPLTPDVRGRKRHTVYRESDMGAYSRGVRYYSCIRSDNCDFLLEAQHYFRCTNCEKSRKRLISWYQRKIHPTSKVIITEEADELQHRASSLEQSSQPVTLSPMAELKQAIEKVSFARFKTTMERESVIFIKYYERLDPMIKVKIDVNFDVSIEVHERQIPKSNPVFADLPSKLENVDIIRTFLSAIDKLTVCTGNAEEKFHGYVPSGKGQSLYCEGNFGAKVGGLSYSSSLRSVDCQFLLGVVKGCKVRCENCDRVRTNLSAWHRQTTNIALFGSNLFGIPEEPSTVVTVTTSPISQPLLPINSQLVSLEDLILEIPKIDCKRFLVDVQTDQVTFVKCYQGENPTAMIHVTIDHSLTPTIRVHNNVVLSAHPLLSDLPSDLYSAQNVRTFLSSLDKLRVCIGNPDEKFHSYLSSKSKGLAYCEGDMGASFGDFSYSSTIRSLECTYLVIETLDWINLRCPACNIHRRKLTVWLGRRMKINRKNTQPGQFQCVVCNEIFTTRTNVVTHMERVHSTRFKCRKCGASFKHNLALARHHATNKCPARPRGE